LPKDDGQGLLSAGDDARNGPGLAPLLKLMFLDAARALPWTLDLQGERPPINTADQIGGTSRRERSPVGFDYLSSALPESSHYRPDDGRFPGPAHHGSTPQANRSPRRRRRPGARPTAQCAGSAGGLPPLLAYQWS